MSKRRKYSPEFKQEAVALTRQPGVSCRQIALEIGINPNLLSRWKREADAVSDKAFGGSGTPRDEEVALPPTGGPMMLSRWCGSYHRQGADALARSRYGVLTLGVAALLLIGIEQAESEGGQAPGFDIGRV